jgi:diphthamide synthase (EF-2-diphthine--ammonia ligase)
MALGHAAIMLSAAAGTAISTLLAIAGDDKQPASARVSAATALANLIEKHSHAEREATEQQRRIESLRRALDEARRDNGLDGTPALPSRTT